MSKTNVDFDPFTLRGKNQHTLDKTVSSSFPQYFRSCIVLKLYAYHLFWNKEIIIYITMCKIDS